MSYATVLCVLCLLATGVTRVGGAGRAEESMAFDGKQGSFSETQPPTPGYIFVTPRRVRENAEPVWFEYTGAFAIDPTHAYT